MAERLSWGKPKCIVGVEFCGLHLPCRIGSDAFVCMIGDHNQDSLFLLAQREKKRPEAYLSFLSLATDRNDHGVLSRWVLINAITTSYFGITTGAWDFIAVSEHGVFRVLAAFR